MFLTFMGRSPLRGPTPFFCRYSTVGRLNFLSAMTTGRSYQGAYRISVGTTTAQQVSLCRSVRAGSEKRGKTYGAVAMLVRRSTLTLLIVVLVASFQSCAGGPYFKWFYPVPDGMATLYVFRPAHDFADSQSQAVYVNDRNIASLSPSTCTVYTTAPGTVNVKIRGLREAYVRFEVEAGKSYFLKSSINTISSHPAASGIDVLTFVDHETGLQEIGDCQPSSDIPTDQRSAH